MILSIIHDSSDEGGFNKYIINIHKLYNDAHTRPSDLCKYLLVSPLLFAYNNKLMFELSMM